MQFIQGTDRHQTYFATLDEQVAHDNPVRLIDAFTDKLDLQQLGFQKSIHKSEGRPPYGAQVLLKLYLYGYLNKIRSSRKLERECIRNIELQWLLQSLAPNYHTIADFRKLHAQSLQSMFRLYVQFLDEAGLLGKTTIAVDGSKFKAVNSKKNNYSQKKIDKYHQFIKEKAEKYLQELDELDAAENNSDELLIKKEKIIQGLEKLKERTCLPIKKAMKKQTLIQKKSRPSCSATLTINLTTTTPYTDGGFRRFRSTSVSCLALRATRNLSYYRLLSLEEYR